MTDSLKIGRSLVLRSALGALLLAAVGPGCGGGGGSPRAATPSGFSLSVPGLSLPVGTVGTVTVTIGRDSTFTGGVTLAVMSTLPKGIKATFASSSTTGTTDELTLEAGYPDPSDPTFGTPVLPTPGATALVIQGISAADPSRTASTTLNLTVTRGTPDFALSLDDGTSLVGDSTLTFHSGADLNLGLVAYNMGENSASYPSGTQVTLATVGLPDGLAVSFPSNPATLDFSQTIILHAGPSLATGTYGFSIAGTTGGATRYLPMVVTYSSGTFWVEPIHALKVEQGSSITLPLDLGRNDTYFVDRGGSNPDYLGDTTLTATTPAGLSAAFLDAGGTPGPSADPTSLASQPFQVTASPSMVPGDYTITLLASRNGVSTSQDVPVTVTAATTGPAYWIQKVEWGQSVLSDTLKLVPGKPALLRVHLLADRPQILSPTVTATILSGGTTLATLPLAGPGTVPTIISEGSLPDTFTALLPAADVVPGMTVRLSLEAGGFSTVSDIQPLVEASGMVLDLVVVPVIHKNLVPRLPADADLRTGINAYWPVQDVSITRRASYTTATVVPPPLASTSTATDYSSDGWIELLTEIAALKVVDDSTASYFGYFDGDLGSLASGTSSIVGLHYLGYGAGLGLDLKSSGRFGDATTVCVQTTVHELGHGFNLNHAPSGGAGGPQLNYPYAGGSIGSYGYDPVAGSLYLPDTTYDIMGYQDPTWVSDWDYGIAQRYLESHGSFANHAEASVADHLVVTGWIGPDGQAHLSPMARATCRAHPPTAGSCSLVLTSGSGTRNVAFQAAEIGCLPRGYRAFAFTVPAGEDLARVEIQEKGRVLLSRKAAAPRKATALASTLEEKDGRLHITWDATTDPIVSVVHEGERRTTLALRLQGGSADLPLENLPRGGRFVILGSDGINHRKPGILTRKGAD